MEEKIRELIEGFVGKESAEGIPNAKELIDKLTAAISRQLTPEKMEKLKAVGITLERAVETLVRTALSAVIAAGKAAERASGKL